jgi:mRNA-degrading endonuclease toxin of MazEF toxin-antitoxin module
MYKQGDVIAVHYPLTDKPAKTKLRPAIVISNEISNQLDNDILVCPITTKTRDSEFSYPLSNDDLTQSLPYRARARAVKCDATKL